MLAFYYACQGLFVDIVSTTRYLAKRDQCKYEDFFKTFGILTSHLCDDFPTKANYRGQIIYATNYDLEFSLMRQVLYQKEHRLALINNQKIPRTQEIAIVYEVDSLFLEGGLTAARLSIPSAHDHRWAYRPMMDFVKTHRKQIEKLLGRSKDDREAFAPIIQELK